MATTERTISVRLHAPAKRQIEQAARLLKQSWPGTHQGSISEHQMHYLLAPHGQKRREPGEDVT